MREKIIVWLLPAEGGERELLGRKVADYAPRALRAFETRYAGSVGEIRAGEGIDVVLPLDMPLVTEEDILRAAATVRSKKLGAMGLGERGSGAFVLAGGGEIRSRLVLPHFVKTEGAKNFRIVYNLMKERVIAALDEAGAVIPDASTVFIDDTVTAEEGAEILPFTVLRGRTVVRAGARVMGSLVEDSVVGERTEVTACHIVGSEIGADCTVGPFARLRGARVGKGCRVGDFVEVKGSALGDGVKSAHLAYIGDAVVGEGTNIGCGTVFCNYDGRKKHRTEVGSGCFIGANVNLVAPLAVGDGAFVAAGTTVTRDVEGGEFVIGRARQESKRSSPPHTRTDEKT